MIRWYPPQWRSRYGGELTALLEDIHPAGEVPLRTRLGLVKAGLEERARAARRVGWSGDHGERVRAGSVLVLCGWALFLVAEALFGKFTDNWAAGTPGADRALPSDGYDAVLVAAIVYCVLVLLAALVVVPAFVRLIRAGRWRAVRRPLLGGVLTSAWVIVLTGCTLLWAHHLSAHDRNGGRPLYGVLFAVTGLSVFVAIGFATAAAVTVLRRVELSGRLVRLLGALAIGAPVVMVTVLAGLVTWWASEAVYAPDVLRHGIGGGIPFASGTTPPTLVVAGLLMLVGLVLASAGSIRVATSFRASRRAA
jgi:hypothetical protein